jgi:peptidoglycan/xylan/chitin deacetylase (PgdA/CDA1 family)
MSLLFKLIRIFTFNYLPWRKKNTLTVFLFHSVNDENQTFYPSISTNTFRKSCEFIKNNYEVIHFNDVEAYFSKYSKPAAIISFDDGMKDIVTNVLPVMQKLGLKFNINIDTEFLESHRPQRFIQVYDILNFGKKKSSYYDSSLMKEPIEINYNSPHITEANFTNLLSKLTLTQKKTFIDTMIESFEFDTAKFTKVISEDDLITLSKNNLIEIGSHSHSHPDFTFLNEQELKFELTHSKEILEKIINKKINIIAYPNGQSTKEIDEQAIACGYQIILKTNDQINSIHSTKNNSYFRIHEYHNNFDMLLAHSYGIIKLIKKILP